MNIFYIHTDPRMCAEWAVDSHCIKMILESAQLLSTAHRILDGIQYTDKTKTGRNVKRWHLDDHREQELYSATHINHPSAIWARESDMNYNWLWAYLEEHCKEYTYRYGKTHKIEQTGLLESLMVTPNNIPKAPFHQPPSAMDPKYIISEDAVTNYRNYYKYGKAHLHKWRNRSAPKWLKEA